MGRLRWQSLPTTVTLLVSLEKRVVMVTSVVAIANTLNALLLDRIQVDALAIQGAKGVACANISNADSHKSL